MTILNAQTAQLQLPHPVFKIYYQGAQCGLPPQVQRLYLLSLVQLHQQLLQFFQFFDNSTLHVLTFQSAVHWIPSSRRATGENLVRNSKQLTYPKLLLAEAGSGPHLNGQKLIVHLLLLFSSRCFVYWAAQLVHRNNTNSLREATYAKSRFCHCLRSILKSSFIIQTPLERHKH